MDNTIERLLEIEEAASRIIDGASKEQQIQDEEQEKRIKKFDESLAAATSLRIEKMKKELSSQIGTDLEKLKEDYDKAEAALDEDYRLKHEKLADEIYEKIIRK